LTYFVLKDVFLITKILFNGDPYLKKIKRGEMKDRAP